MSNFFSVNKEVVLDFEVNEKEGKENIHYIKTSNGTFNKIAVLFGPNASGKTNILKIFGFIGWLFEGSTISEIDKEIMFEPFLLKNKISPTHIEAVFENKGKTFKYITSFKKNGFIAEELYELNKKTGYFNYIFKRSLKKNGGYAWKHNGKINELKGSMLKKQVSVIRLGLLLNNTLCQDIALCWSVYTDVGFTGKNSLRVLEGGDFSQKFKRVTNLLNENEDILKMVERSLIRFDIGINKLRIFERKIEQKDGNTLKELIPILERTSETDTLSIPFPLESSGTTSLYVLLTYIYSALQNGGIACFDELDAFIHPHILPEIIDLFIDKSSNPHNAQLIMSSHSINLLNHLNKDQIYFTDMGRTLSTNLWRLDQIKGVKNTDNFLKKYSAGTYGATPDIQ